MKTEPPEPGRCIARLGVWFILVHCAGSICAPGLSRISYPQPLDLLVLAIIPVSAFHAARFARPGVVFTAYGALASSVFWLYYLFVRGSRITDDAVFQNRIITASAVTIALAAACRFAASLRNRWDQHFRPPPGHCQACGYNLTGNVSGVCPECGEQL